jgi:hypothetical protein
MSHIEERLIGTKTKIATRRLLSKMMGELAEVYLGRKAEGGSPPLAQVLLRCRRWKQLLL